MSSLEIEGKFRKFFLALCKKVRLTEHLNMLRDLITRLFEPKEIRPLENIVPQGQDHWLALYNNALEEIRFLKNQQWRIANYALLLYAAIIVISSQYIKQPLTAQNRPLLPVLSILIALVATVILYSVEFTIRNARYQDNKIASEHFPENVRTAITEFQKLPPKEPSITLILALVVWLSGLLTVWLILLNLGAM